MGVAGQRQPDAGLRRRAAQRARRGPDAGCRSSREGYRCARPRPEEARPVAGASGRDGSRCARSDGRSCPRAGSRSPPACATVSCSDRLRCARYGRWRPPGRRRRAAHRGSRDVPSERISISVPCRMRNGASSALSRSISAFCSTMRSSVSPRVTPSDGRVIGQHHPLPSAVARGAGHDLDRVHAIGPVRVDVCVSPLQVATVIRSGSEPLPRDGCQDLAVALAQLGRDPGQVEARVDLLLVGVQQQLAAAPPP